MERAGTEQSLGSCDLTKQQFVTNTGSIAMLLAQWAADAGQQQSLHTLPRFMANQFGLVDTTWAALPARWWALNGSFYGSLGSQQGRQFHDPGERVTVGTAKRIAATQAKARFVTGLFPSLPSGDEVDL